MASLEQETSRALDLLDRERVASTLPEQDEGRSQLLGLVEKDLASAPPLRPRIAAQLLTLSERQCRHGPGKAYCSGPKARPRGSC